MRHCTCKISISLTYLSSSLLFLLIYVCETMVVQLCSEEETLRAVWAVVRPSRWSVFQHVTLKTMSCREHSTAQVASEGGTTSECVFCNMK